MTLSKLIPQAVAQQLLSEHPSTALDLALEVVRLVSLAKCRDERAGSLELLTRRQAAADRIIGAVCQHFEINEKWLRSRDRREPASRARKIAYALIRWRLQWSYTDIGAEFERDHTTVMAAVRSIDMNSPAITAICQRLDAGAEAAE